MVFLVHSFVSQHFAFHFLFLMHYVKNVMPIVADHMNLCLHYVHVYQCAMPVYNALNGVWTVKDSQKTHMSF